jgi:hypothetical protein
VAYVVMQKRNCPEESIPNTIQGYYPIVTVFLETSASRFRARMYKTVPPATEPCNGHDSHPGLTDNYKTFTVLGPINVVRVVPRSRKCNIVQAKNIITI